MLMEQLIFDKSIWKLVNSLFQVDHEELVAYIATWLSSSVLDTLWLGLDSSILRLEQLYPWLAIFQWKTLLVDQTLIGELGESQPWQLLFLPGTCTPWPEPSTPEPGARTTRWGLSSQWSTWERFEPAMQSHWIQSWTMSGSQWQTTKWWQDSRVCSKSLSRRTEHRQISSSVTKFNKYFKSVELSKVLVRPVQLGIFCSWTF